jgi:eukaryotic-like serine/threonine-protein kinase
MILVLFMNGYWKIADFGLTSEATSNRLVSTSAARGKPCYRAPEMLRETSPGFNNKMDMWSFGCIAYELLTGRKAFSSDYEVFSYSISKKNPKTYFKDIDPITKFYISDLFELEPDNRPAASSLARNL